MTYLQQQLQSRVSVQHPHGAWQVEAGSHSETVPQWYSSGGPKVKVLKRIKYMTFGFVECLQEFKGSRPEPVCVCLVRVGVR